MGRLLDLMRTKAEEFGLFHSTVDPSGRRMETWSYRSDCAVPSLSLISRRAYVESTFEQFDIITVATIFQ